MSLLYPQALLLFLPLLWLYQKEPQKIDKLFIALSLLILALSRPVLHEYKQNQKLQARDLIIALDVSFSMHATDLKPSRLKAAKKAIETMLQHNSHDRFSLFAFTTNPLILSPSTSDHTLLLSALNSLKVENILTHGTNLQKLLERISSLQTPRKELLLFSDGGDDLDLPTLNHLAKKAHITIHVIATATQTGTYLTQKDGKKLKDEKGNLIITHLNPKLKILADHNGGEFFMLEDFDGSLDFIHTKEYAQKEQLSLYELFWIPTLLALLLFLASFIQIPKKLLAWLPLLALPTEAGLLDWYHIQEATSAYHDKSYKEAIKHFQSITNKTIQSELNLANSYYQAGEYTQAKSIYNTLKTTNPHFKKEILFKLGNCAVHQKEYEKARRFYHKALHFGRDADILANLRLIYKKKTKQRRDFPAFHSPDKDRKDTPQGNNKKQQKNNSTGKKSNQEGASSQAKGKSNKQKTATSNSQAGKLSHPLGYKVYELINKGYLDEKTPW
jgi:Ca-activated chloride channel family protein